MTTSRPNPTPVMKEQKLLSGHDSEWYLPFHRWVCRFGTGVVYLICKLILPLLFLLLFRVKCVGLENVPRKGAFIMAPNHVSFMDHFVAAMRLRRWVHFVAKASMFDKRLFGWFFALGGVIPANRGRKDPYVGKTVGTVLRRGKGVVAYAEGGRSRQDDDTSRRPVYPGVGRWALENGVPIIPVAIEGTQGMRYWKQWFSWRPGMPNPLPRVTVRYGKPIPVEFNPNPTNEECLALSQRAMDQVREELAQIEPR